MRDLNWKIDNNGTFSDFTQDSRDYLRDKYLVQFDTTDFIYIGLYKPFFKTYAEFAVPTTTPAILAWEYWNGSSWTTLIVDDETKLFTRSGFVSWDRGIEDTWEATAVDSQELYWIRVSTDTLLANLDIQGWNIVFSDDNDLMGVQRKIENFKAKGDLSFIAYHQNARNEIVQTLVNGDRRVRNADGELFALTKWDLLEFDEVRNASKYLTLALIMLDVSSEIDDKYHQKYQQYNSLYMGAFKLAQLSIDTNDDGKKEQNENLAPRSITSVKV